MNEKEYIWTFEDPHNAVIKLHDTVTERIMYKLSLVFHSIDRRHRYVNDMASLNVKLRNTLIDLIKIGSEVMQLDGFRTTHPHNISFNVPITTEPLSAYDILHTFELYHGLSKYVVDSLLDTSDRLTTKIGQTVLTGMLTNDNQIDELVKSIEDQISTEVRKRIHKSTNMLILRVKLSVFHKLIMNILENGFKSEIT